jgi:hypothetical protein
MPFQFSPAVRNASLDAVESTIGTAPTLELRSGAVPANSAAADAGTLLASGVLPSDWLANAATGSKTIAGVWTLIGQAAAGGGTSAGHFRLKTGVTTHIQGTVTVTGGGGDMTLDNISIANAQQVSVTSFTLTAGGA